MNIFLHYIYDNNFINEGTLLGEMNKKSSYLRVSCNHSILFLLVSDHKNPHTIATEWQILLILS